jgi:hypothetical protein
MKTLKPTLIAMSAIIIAACSTSKKSTTTAIVTPTVASTSASTPTAAARINPLMMSRPSNKIYPGNEELLAIQIQYKEVTLDKLKEGYSIYSEGACIKCHNAENIYNHSESKWKEIIDDMAQKANLSDSQKDDVYKYVLAIKATQPK